MCLRVQGPNRTVQKIVKEANNCLSVERERAHMIFYLSASALQDLLGPAPITSAAWWPTTLHAAR